MAVNLRTIHESKPRRFSNHATFSGADINIKSSFFFFRFFIKISIFFLGLCPATLSDKEKIFLGFLDIFFGLILSIKFSSIGIVFKDVFEKILFKVKEVNNLGQ